MNLDKNPYEAGLDPFIKTNKKTRFIGQEAVKELKFQEQKCQLAMLQVDTMDVLDPSGNETVWHNNKVG